MYVLLPFQMISAQTLKEIKGKVRDAVTGDPVSQVNIIVRGTNRGIATNSTGEYSIQAKNGDVLVFSIVGYENKEETVANQPSLDITLTPGVSKLDEVVVVGYGTQKKSDLTGAVGSVKRSLLQQRPAATVAQELAGRIPGVNVSVNSGRPGGKPTIRIRGNSSISITNDPLYIVDGVISSIEFLDPNNIASIEVLKDASSTAIYGARGSNGVVLVTTKRGSRAGGKVEYNTEISIGKLPKEIRVLNSKEFFQLEDISYQNALKYDTAGWRAGAYQDPKLKRTNPLLFDASGNPLYDTDWQKETMQDAFTQNHNISVTGGDAKSTYGVYLGAVKSLLSSVYLTMAGFPLQLGAAYYQKAADKASEVMQSNKYSLFNSYNDFHNPAVDNTGENIFQVQFTALVLPSLWQQAIVPYNKGISAYSGQSGAIFADVNFVNSFESGDKRAQERQYFYTKYTLHSNRSVTIELGNRYIYKLFDSLAQNSTASSGLNWTLMRFPEILLIYAEASNEVAGPTAASYEAVNKIRRRALLPELSGLTKDKFKEAIWRESFHELCFENKSWFNMVRLRKAYNVTTNNFDNYVGHKFSYGPVLKEKELLFPIPTSAMQTNKNLVQNTGY
ncbi:MAG: RagB/SusD family nutrient uptake outer membrane protein [Chitinophagaceae bacterium]